ncbi:MAG: hypothetical protein NTV97_36045 [Alphaproteobacteria bacterium]|nr:hypothetical protein [Alphaproteobacteria bacterium]
MSDNVFAVIRTRGPRWDREQPLEGQKDWQTHADFMNGLVADGFMLLGGPLEGTQDVLLIVRAENEADIEERLAVDCWSVDGLLRTVTVHPWQLRLGSLALT